MEDSLPRKEEAELVRKLCSNLREHPEEWSFSEYAINNSSVQIMRSAGLPYILLPAKYRFRFYNAIKLRGAIKTYIKYRSADVKIRQRLKETISAINNLSSKYNDPLIKYRDRFDSEPPLEIVEFAKKQAKI